jgi:DNA-binding beta-propeller fold protein YncE
MFAVPVPAPVVIDGNLDEWDRSAELETYVMAASRDQQHGKLAVMYDEDALYLGGEVRKPIPAANRHSPEGSGDRAWDADSLQFRLGIDPALGYPLPRNAEQVVHLLLWRYSDRDEACLQAGSSMKYQPLPGAEKFGVIPKGLYQAAYKMAPDGNGYTFEYRIPWKTLGVKNPPKAGDTLAATYQFNFGRADGLMTLRDAGWAYDLKGSSGFAYQNAGCWGKLVFSKTGKLPRDLVDEGLPLAKPSPLKFEYDLTTSGNVSLALYDAKNEIVRVLAADAPRQAGRVVEQWDGLDEVGAPLPAGQYTWKGLVHEPITTSYVMSLHNSGQPAYKTDDATGGWGGDHGVPSAACALGDDILLAWNGNECGSGLIRVDGDGKKKWGVINSQSALATDGERVFAQTLEFGVGIRCYDAKDGRPMPWGDGKSILTLPPGGDAKTNIASALAYHDGKLYAAFKDRDLIAVYDAKQGTLETTWAIPSPVALAVRPDGTLAAISNGKLVELKAGKPAPLASDHLDQPSGVAVAADGTIYVANQGELQNISVFSPKGAYLKSIGKKGGRPWVGRFDPAGMLQPSGLALDTKGRLWVMESIDSPKRVSVWDTITGKLAREFFGGAHYASFIWMDPQRPDEAYCDGVIWKIDWETQSSLPYATCWRNIEAPEARTFSTHTGGFRPFTAKNGRQYGLDLGTNTIYMRDGDIFKPILTVKGPDSIWVDQNNDQIVQPAEIIRTPKGRVNSISWIDPELTIWGLGQKFRPLRIDPDGRPVYDFTAPEAIAEFRPMGEDSEDGSFYSFDSGYDISGSLKGFDYGRFREDGTVLWGYRGRIGWPDGLQLPPQRSGKIWGPTQLLGTAGEFTGFGTYYGCLHLYTRREGLPVAMLFRDVRVALGKLGPDIIASENYNGQLVKPKGMDRYFALGGDQDGRITEVFGLETVKRLPGGTFTLSEEDVQKAAAAMRDYEAKLTKERELVVSKGLDALASAPAVEKVLTPGQSFKARLAYDADNLYVRYEVVSAAELTNGAVDPQTIFKGGNLLDIQIAADPAADPKRTTPAAGDVRVLVTRQGGKPFAVIFRPHVKGFNGTPIVLTSPTGKESFDAIETSEKIKLDYDPTPDGFIATVTIPLAELGWKPEPGGKVRLDLGYIFGNNAGTKATGRAYWANKGFAAGVLNDLPNESRLVPKEWGEARVEK